ncbi:MaoC family dehydratase [Enterobacter bugandensis]
MQYTIKQLSIGQSECYTKKITDSDIMAFANASGDMNPVHTDDEAAKSSIFKQRIAHGILVSGLISAVLANKLPGAGSIYLAQTLKFIKPTFIDDTITATVEVINIDRDKNKVTLKTFCTNQHGITVITGEAIVLAPKKDK